MARGLSELQKSILIMALQNRLKVRTVEKRLTDYNQGRKYGKMDLESFEKYYPMETDIFFNEFIGAAELEKTNAVKASISRAFRRLEERELVKREYWTFHNDVGANLTIKGKNKGEELMVNE
jgi:hypothetical protein